MRAGLLSVAFLHKLCGPDLTAERRAHRRRRELPSIRTQFSRSAVVVTTAGVVDRRSTLAAPTPISEEPASPASTTDSSRIADRCARCGACPVPRDPGSVPRSLRDSTSQYCERLPARVLASRRGSGKRSLSRSACSRGCPVGCARRSANRAWSPVRRQSRRRTHATQTGTRC